MLKIFILFILSLLCYKISQTPNKTTSNDFVKETVPRIGYWLGPIWFLLLFIGYSYTYYTFNTGDLDEWEYTEVFGFVLTVISALGRLWSYQTLGRLFTFDLAIRSRHKLITTGPYKYIRHPSYTGLILATLGYCLYILKVGDVVRQLFNIPYFLYLGMMMSSPVFIAVLIINRIPKEEEMLQKEFKEKWIGYKEKTWKLIPFY